MNRNMRKILSVILVFTTICSILTISYASGAISAITKPIVNIIDNAENKTSAARSTLVTSDSENNGEPLTMGENEVTSLEKMEASNNSERLTASRPPKAQIMSASVLTEQETVVAERTEPTATAGEISAKRAEKLQNLIAKYPSEYAQLVENTDINSNLHANLLEIYDYWNVEDFAEFLNDYIADGLGGLQKYHTITRAEVNSDE